MPRRLVIDGARERMIVVALLVAAAAIRFGWVLGMADGLSPRLTESQRVGVALATTGQFADAFRDGSGPTAHLSPLMPWLISLVYRALGVATPPAELGLSAVAIGLIVASFAFAYLLFRDLGPSLWARLGALAAVALIPVQIPLEARELKVWEAPLVVAAVTGVLWWAVRLDRRPTLDWRAVVPLVVPGALLAVASPPAALAIFAIVALVTIRRLPVRQWLAPPLVAAVLTAAVVAPWAWRNERVLGRPIVTRSNSNLELAIAYNDTVLREPDRRAGYIARMAQIHPMVQSGGGYAAMRAAGGEIAYYDRLGDQTRAWIAAHPGDTATLVLRHLRQYLVPPAWFFATWGAEAHATGIRRWLLALPTLIALVGLPLLVWRDRRFLYPLVAIILLAAPYIVVQPVLRYRYLTSTLIVFVAFDALARVVQRRRLSVHQPIS